MGWGGWQRGEAERQTWSGPQPGEREAGGSVWGGGRVEDVFHRVWNVHASVDVQLREKIVQIQNQHFYVLKCKNPVPHPMERRGGGINPNNQDSQNRVTRPVTFFI